MQAPIIIGIAHNWNARLRPSPSDIQPLNKEPRSAPARHVLTTKPTDHNKKWSKGDMMSVANKKLIHIGKVGVPSAKVLPLKPSSTEMLSNVSLTTLNSIQYVK